MSGKSKNNNPKSNPKGPMPIKVIKRLPIYYRYLFDLMERRVERISSGKLGEKLDLTSSQIRQDLSYLGSFGQRGYGYNVYELHDEIGKILGINRNMQMVLIGGGNLGKAIANYPKFSQRGFLIKAIFDRDLDLIGEKINGVPIYNVNKLAAYLDNFEIDIGIIATPPEAAEEMAQILINNGIKGIWNFAPVTFDIRNDVLIENVHISESLFTLSCRIKEKYEN